MDSLSITIRLERKITKPYRFNLKTAAYVFQKKPKTESKRLRQTHAWWQIHCLVEDIIIKPTCQS